MKYSSESSTSKTCGPFTSPRAQRNFTWVALAILLFYALLSVLVVYQVRSLHIIQGQITAASAYQGRHGPVHLLEFECHEKGKVYRGSEDVDVQVYRQHVGNDGKVLPALIPVYLSDTLLFERATLKPPEIEWILWIAGALWILALPGCTVIFWQSFARRRKASTPSPSESTPPIE